MLAKSRLFLEWKKRGYFSPNITAREQERIDWQKTAEAIDSNRAVCVLGQQRSQPIKGPTTENLGSDTTDWKQQPAPQERLSNAVKKALWIACG